MKITILPNQFLKENGTFDKEGALKLSGHIAGLCYNANGLKAIQKENPEKTDRRVNISLKNGHHSVFEHIYITYYIEDIPKILAMVLNNEKAYTTTEKSLRYTEIDREKTPSITEEEQNLYNKWVDIFKGKIKSKYGHIYSDSKIGKLAQENARYLINVFVPTKMVYTTSLRQINYLASWMEEYIKNIDKNDQFQVELAKAMDELYINLYYLNVLEPGLMTNDKKRHISLFNDDIEKKEEYFKDSYSTTYEGSYAELAQAQRHRTLDYEIKRQEEKKYYIPPILEEDLLKQEWIRDISSLNNNPQGEMILINEMGTLEDFILKCKERLCTEAQLEIMRQTKKTLLQYKEAVKNNEYLSNKIEPYTHGARCTFKDFTCNSDCNFTEGKRLVRKI